MLFMATVTLAKALKLKNRQIQKVKETQARIESSNSFLAGSEPDFDAKALYDDLKKETERLWRLKLSINAANVPIHAAIYELAETKGLIAFLKGLDTKRGLSAVAGYMPIAPHEYRAQISAGEVGSEIETLEARIDSLQDLLDIHNATATVEVEG